MTTVDSTRLIVVDMTRTAMDVKVPPTEHFRVISLKRSPFPMTIMSDIVASNNLC